jgi:adenylosuccinate lyase
MVASEWLLFRLAGKMGKTRALAVLQTASAKAVAEHRALADLLLADPETSILLDEVDLAIAAAPEAYLGEAHAIVDAVIGNVARKLQTD